MLHLPEIHIVRRNSSPATVGTFIDAEWVWHYVAKGKWEFRMGGKTWRATPGDSVLIPPRLLHVVRSCGGGERLHEVIHFILPDIHSIDDYEQVIALPDDERERVRARFREIELIHGAATAGAAEKGRRLEAAGLLAAILGVHLGHGARARQSTPSVAPGWPETERAVRHLQQNHRRADLRLDEVGRVAGVSPNYLCRVFKRNMGCSVMEYLAAYRVEQAESFLLTTNLNCSQIAEAAGFSGLHVFSHAFRRANGVAPTEFRARHGRLGRTAAGGDGKTL